METPLKDYDVPRVGDSTRAERLAYVRKRFRCIANCETCGNCQTFHGREPELALADYIEGKVELGVLMAVLRGR